MMENTLFSRSYGGLIARGVRACTRARLIPRDTACTNDADTCRNCRHVLDRARDLARKVLRVGRALNHQVVLLVINYTMRRVPRRDLQGFVLS